MLRILTSAEQEALLDKYAELTRLRAAIFRAELEVTEARNNAEKAANDLEECLQVGNDMFRYWVPDVNVDGLRSVGKLASRSAGGGDGGRDKDEGGDGGGAYSGADNTEVMVTTISMGPALKILRSRYAAKEKLAAETAKLAVEKGENLEKLRRREQCIVEVIADIENTTS